MTANGDPAVGQLVEQLAIGFDTLSSEYRILHDRHRELENKLVWAKQQYLDLLKRFTPDIALQDHKVHEVCIKRFQSNAESIRQLDAKYGSLVNMIQGLGEKHQPMLKESPTDEDAVIETESGGRVADWAKAVSTSAQAGGDASPDPEQPLPEEEERQPHFDRPMKEIRVGESPSRPPTRCAERGD
ncbi:hypothetical protein UCDDS831_g00267 [Diplodia seriata]|uniref:Uncharacterized protein n=1 Tax=Diplodia seriata TaxID=420778 RepID=A0A0G2F2M3_9PEZI|nr:hypothetical protein UCDDS831_g00267 [Diplodia seriata]